MSFITLTERTEDGLTRVAIDADAVTVIGEERDGAILGLSSSGSVAVAEDFATVIQLVDEHRSWELVEVVSADDLIGNHGDLVVRRARR